MKVRILSAMVMGATIGLLSELTGTGGGIFLNRSLLIRALVLLADLDAAESLQDLSPLMSVNLHRLRGDRAGQWAMMVNGRWWICFRFRNGNTNDVEITDFHQG